MRAEFRVMMSFLLMYDIKKKNTNTQQTNKQTNKQTTTATTTIKKQKQSKCPTPLLPL